MFCLFSSMYRRVTVSEQWSATVKLTGGSWMSITGYFNFLSNTQRCLTSVEQCWTLCKLLSQRSSSFKHYIVLHSFWWYVFTNLNFNVSLIEASTTNSNVEQEMRVMCPPWFQGLRCVVPSRSTDCLSKQLWLFKNEIQNVIFFFSIMCIFFTFLCKLYINFFSY